MLDGRNKNFCLLKMIHEGFCVGCRSSFGDIIQIYFKYHQQNGDFCVLKLFAFKVKISRSRIRSKQHLVPRRISLLHCRFSFLLEAWRVKFDGKFRVVSSIRKWNERNGRRKISRRILCGSFKKTTRFTTLTVKFAVACVSVGQILNIPSL